MNMVYKLIFSKLNQLSILLFIILFSSCRDKQTIKLLFSVLDTNNSYVEFEISKDYEKLIEEKLGNQSNTVTDKYLYANDTAFYINPPDSLKIPSFVIGSEYL